MDLLITGASGYIGRRLVTFARSAGYRVVASTRSGRPAPAGLERRAFDLAHPDGADEALAGVAAVIHLAAILGDESWPAGESGDRNVRGTRALLEASRRSGVRRFVFLSSQSASADAPSRYGQSKFRIEQMLTGEGEVAVRTGMVSGGPPRGVYGQLFRMVRRGPLLPVLRPGAPLYPIHVDDLCRGLVALVGQAAPPPHLVRLAARESMPFAAYLRLVARERLGRRLRLLPVPTAAVLAVSRLTELVPFLPRLSRERVSGLAALGRMDPGPEWPDVQGIDLRDLGPALGLEGRRRRLAAEGRSLLGYVMGRRARAGWVRRYVRGVLAEADPEPLDLGGMLLGWPALLRFVEPLGAGPSRLRRRLSIAVRVAEMTPEGARRFHSYRERSRWATLLGLAALLVVEGLLWPFRAVLGRRGRRP